ncbi:MAG: iron-sulfur cluster assembly accessory protein [Archangium sp.]|nr:iron-sulfur cluster assembly accessory protein [Archangium sp.]MDP3158007.1 iron-sulfur cluster assembly accessory protein [Archangium sp.]MDP3574865.1 iron-sulfur cluster assembly accessory protein [Archangium sp.]
MDTSVAAPEVAPTVTLEVKPMILTERAVAQVKEVMTEQKLDGHYLTVRVVPAGCSGLGYDLNLVKETKEGDIVWTQDGVMVATDVLSTQYLKGTQVDYVKTDTSAGFKFENPNAKSSCGCGSSFSA